MIEVWYENQQLMYVDCIDLAEVKRQASQYWNYFIEFFYHE